jgi:maleate cis-trans isomerase
MEEHGMGLEAVQWVAGAESELHRAARDLATVRSHVIAWMCTSGSFSLGSERDTQQIRLLEEASGAKAITTSSSLVAAMRALSVRKVAVGAPYEEPVNVKLKEYLEIQGLEVVSLHGLSCSEDWEVASFPPQVSYALAQEADCPEAEAVLISCTGMRMMELAEIAESDLGKPVISANMATMWNALRTAGINEPMGGLGTLFTI